MSNIAFNEHVRLILADVDETIVDVYIKATPEMVQELEKLLKEGRVLFLVSGGGLQSIRERITDLISPGLRHRIVIAHCSGAEVWGFEPNGEIKPAPYFGVYEGHFTDEQKKKWREIIQNTVEKFHLVTYPTQPRNQFIETSKGNPLAVMLADRGPQITLECVNSTNLTEEQKLKIEQELGITIPHVHGTYDLRFPILDFLEKQYQEFGLPITPKFAGTFALDCPIKGVDKTTAIKFVLEHDTILSQLDIHASDIDHANEIEIWGDKFAQKKGGPDFQMCQAVSPEVRAIDFRDEDTNDFPKGYNIQIWHGKQQLHDGLLEYLQSRQ